MKSDSINPTRLFYQFSGIHSFLIGLLPFFIPALLWQGGFSLSVICWFIAINGLSYLVTLYVWDRIRVSLGWNLTIAFSFLIELMVVGGIVLDSSLVAIYSIACINGVYGCFFWMSQRLIFVHCTDASNSGRKFGNSQIIVMILLKAGILSGGFLWEMWGSGSVFWISACVVIPALYYYLTLTFPESLWQRQAPRATLKEVFRFRDDIHSRPVFFADGLFLFAESYFWVLSLYIISGENFASLGVLVVSLSIILAGLFYFIKNTLDGMNADNVYNIAVIAYSLSWLLRAFIDIDANDFWIYPDILVIAFLSAFFRLAFNKRFFDISRKNATHRYLVIKSYYSQTGILILFGVSGFLLEGIEAFAGLQLFYSLLVPISFVYLMYKNRPVISSPE